MATPVHEIASMPTTAERQKAIDAMNSATHNAEPQTVAPNRTVVPLALISILILLFFVSPYLPIGVREYISALVR
jgi:hypothetical protein